MLKLKYLPENFDLARLALTNWQHDADTLQERLGWFRISSNAVYPFDCGGQLCFLRLSPAEEKNEDELRGELDFLAWLRRCGYPAMCAIPALSGEYLLQLDTPWGLWYASAFERVPGRSLEDLTMTDDLAMEYGAALGRLHELSMRYDAPVRRRSYRDVIGWIGEMFRLYGRSALLAKLKEVETQLAELPADRSSYGLVHYDFEPDNVFWDGKRCSVIDFEDGMLHFYAVDVVKALDELADEYHAAFLRGYRAACPAAKVEEPVFPLMRCFCRLYTCARLLHSLSEKPVPEPEWLPELTAHLEELLREAESSIG